MSNTVADFCRYYRVRQFIAGLKHSYLLNDNSLRNCQLRATRMLAKRTNTAYRNSPGFVMSQILGTARTLQQQPQGAA